MECFESMAYIFMSKFTTGLINMSFYWCCHSTIVKSDLERLKDSSAARLLHKITDNVKENVQDS